MSNPVYVACDTPLLDDALSLIKKVQHHVGGVKLGLEFFCANGHHGVHEVAKLGLPIFLDLKLHDIPNTVAGAVRAIAPLAPSILTVHAGGGLAMMQAAREAAAENADKLKVKRPSIVGVTVLTSLDDKDLAAVGQSQPVSDQVKRLANLARTAGLDGIVCSPHEIEAIRAEIGEEFLLVVPGVRPGGADTGDQKRVRTPGDAGTAVDIGTEL